MQREGLARVWQGWARCTGSAELASGGAWQALGTWQGAKVTRSLPSRSLLTAGETYISHMTTMASERVTGGSRSVPCCIRSGEAAQRRDTGPEI